MLHSHFTPEGAPAYAKASKLYDWYVRTIAKISPKMARNSPKTAIFRHFDFLKNCPYDSNEVFNSHSTACQSSISITLYDWDSSESEGKRAKPTPLPHMRLWFLSSPIVFHSALPGLTLLLASWLSWRDLAEFLLQLGNHGSHGKILIKIILIPRSYLIAMDKILF